MMNSNIEHNRYDRQERIKGWRQQSLAQARVVIVGAGALGNELIKNLALLGVGKMVIIDFDHIDISNLSRTVLFREQDIGRPKSEVAAVRAREINPEIDARHLVADVFHDIGMGLYHHADLVVGCLDNIAARSHIGICCALTGVPFLDGGMWDLGGEVRWFLPGEQACFECTLSEIDKQHAFERRSCTGFKVADPSSETFVPSTITTASIIGGFLSQETARLLCGWDVAGGEALVYNGLTGAMHRSKLARQPDCPYHSPYREIIELGQGAETMTGRELLARAKKDLGDAPIIELGRDLLASLSCAKCNTTEEVNTLLGKVDESRAKCPICGGWRTPNILSRLGDDNPLCDRALDELGVPAGEILAVRTNEKIMMYELKLFIV